jgi:peptide chain release factor 1
VLEAAEALLAEHAELERRLADPAVHTDQALARRLARRYAELTPVVAARAAWLAAESDVQAAQELGEQDASFAEEVPALQVARDAAADRLRRLLVPRDPDDDRDVILEIKAGEGGEESALFAADLLRMYLRYAEHQGWSTEVLDSTESDLGGYKDVSVAVKSRGTPQPGQGVWSRL